MEIIKNKNNQNIIDNKGTILALIIILKIIKLTMNRISSIDFAFLIILNHIKNVYVKFKQELIILKILGLDFFVIFP